MNKAAAHKKRISYLRFCALIFLLLTASYVCAEHLPIKIYTSADGLGSSASFNLVRDSRGFIWLCSRDGLIRFDGYRFITYKIGNDDADPAVFDLLPTSKNIYWINLNRGTDYRFVAKSDATVLEPLQQTLAKNDPRIPLNVQPLTDTSLPDFEDSKGNLWTSDRKGIYLMREANGKYNPEQVELRLFENPVDGLMSTSYNDGRDGCLWVGTHWGLVRRLPDGKMIHYLLQPENNSDLVRYFAEDKEGRIWIARPNGIMVLKVESLSALSNIDAFTSRKAVVKNGAVDKDGQINLSEQSDAEAVTYSFADILRRPSIKGFNKDNGVKPEIYGMICASDGKVWITSSHGLIVFDGKGFRHYTTEHGLGSNTLTSIVEDNEKHIWIASYGGLHRINPNGLTAFDESDGFEKARVHSIYENHNGEIQIVSGNFNISGVQNDIFKMVSPNIPKDSIWMWQSNAAFLDSRGEWWINTSKNLYRFTGISRLEDLANKKPAAVYNSKNGLLSDNIIRVFEDSKGDIWTSTFPTGEKLGLTRWQRSTGNFQHFTADDGLPKPAAATAFAEDRDGNIWFGFIEGGIARYKDGRFTMLNEEGMPGGGVTGLHLDKSGRMWIATSRGGMGRVDNPTAEHPTFKRYTIAEGLTSNNIRCITEDLYGNIYVGTVRGVNRLSPETGRVKYYGTSDGLASDFVSVAYRDSSGAIWFGTFNGLSKLVPEPDAPLQPPTILISGLRIAGVDYSVSPLGQREVFVPEQSANRNNLQIDFLSISTGDASTRYQYKLESVDTDWSLPTAERSVTLANLSPGAYRFQVRAINADEVMSPQPAVIYFTVLRPVWQRWWFISSVALLIGLGVYAFYRYRVSHLLKLERVRTRIATDLHDDIGSSLSQIAILSEVVRQKVGDKANGTTEPLNLIADKSREMVDSMSDIVWAINPHKDHLGDLVHRMHRFAGDMLESKDIAYHFTLPDEDEDVSLGADIRREVYLMFKECVNNLVKHSDATRAEIEIKLERDCLIIKIGDNGRGFDVEHQSNGNSNGFGGNGLKNMMRRTENLDGEFLIDSRKGEGTRITMKIPVSKKLFVN